MKRITSPARAACMISPAVNFPDSKASASGFSINRWIVRFSGLAP